MDIDHTAPRGYDATMPDYHVDQFSNAANKLRMGDLAAADPLKTCVIATISGPHLLTGAPMLSIGATCRQHGIVASLPAGITISLPNVSCGNTLNVQLGRDRE